MVLKVTDFNHFLCCGCGGLERTHFQHFLLQTGVVVLKELIFDHFLLLAGVVVYKEIILTVDTLRGCGGLKVTDF